MSGTEKQAHLIALSKALEGTAEALAILKLSLDERDRVKRGRGRPRGNLIGLTYGKLKIQRDIGTTASGSLWIAKCECGAEVLASAEKLRAGHVTACRDCS